MMRLNDELFASPNTDTDNGPEKGISSLSESALSSAPSLESILQCGRVIFPWMSSVVIDTELLAAAVTAVHRLGQQGIGPEPHGQLSSAGGCSCCCCCLGFITLAGDYKSGAVAGGCCFLV